MRLPKSAHTSRPWRIHELTRDFRLEDVWSLPTPGGPDDFPGLVQMMASSDPSRSSSGVFRTLFAIRWKVGKLLGWDRPETGLGSRVTSLRDRLPADLRDAPPGPEFDGLPFTALYLLDDEFAAEIANRTVHGVMHIGWVADKAGVYHGQMAVYVKPNGLLGNAYMAMIAPFRHLIVYPPMIRQIGRNWRARTGQPTSAHSHEGTRSTPPHSPTSTRAAPPSKPLESPSPSGPSTTSATPPSPTKPPPATPWPTSKTKPATPNSPSPSAASPRSQPASPAPLRAASKRLLARIQSAAPDCEDLGRR